MEQDARKEEGRVASQPRPAVGEPGVPGSPGARHGPVVVVVAVVVGGGVGTVVVGGGLVGGGSVRVVVCAIVVFWSVVVLFALVLDRLPWMRLAAQESLEKSALRRLRLGPRRIRVDARRQVLLWRKHRTRYRPPLALGADRGVHLVPLRLVVHRTQGTPHAARLLS